MLHNKSGTVNGQQREMLIDDELEVVAVVDAKNAPSVQVPVASTIKESNLIEIEAIQTLNKQHQKQLQQLELEQLKQQQKLELEYLQQKLEEKRKSTSSSQRPEASKGVKSETMPKFIICLD
jgi:hypothetical protein